MNFFERHFGASHVQHHSFHGTLVEFIVFLEFLKKGSLPTDSTKYRKANVERTVHGYEKGTIFLKDNTQEWITSGAILKYIFSYNSDIAVCSVLAEEVHSVICQQQHKCPTEQCESFPTPISILDLYKLIASQSYREEELDAFYINHFRINDTDLPTLYVIHKTFFSEYEWKRIMYFEHHFSLAYGTDPKKTHAIELSDRTKYLRLLYKAREMTDELHTISKQTVQSRNMRKESGNVTKKTQLKGAMIHLYESLDQQIQVDVEKCTQSDVTVITIPSSSSNHVSVCIDPGDTTHVQLSDVHTIVSGYLMNKHSLVLDELLLLGTRTCKSYYRKELKGYARFILHDDLLTEKVKPTAVFSQETSHECDFHQEDESPEKCECCFPKCLPRPLNISSFNLLQEWVLDVPLIVQLLFESAINIRYFKKSSDKSKFLQPKLTKLYMCYDTMLHSLNYRHIGLLQQVNTLELIMHSKCLDTVFQVASTSGAAMCLTAAQNYLERNTVDDILYYNTYIKPQPLTYMCKGVEVTNDVSLRQCIIILMVDNLVRLKYRDDPNPGENRSKQLNTLPITLQGIPMDSDEVASWHEKTCDGSSNCLCKEAQEIPSEDLVPVLVTLLPDEEAVQTRFAQLCTWGYPCLWKKLLADDFIGKIDSAVQSTSPLQQTLDTTSRGESDTLQALQATPSAPSLNEWEDSDDTQITDGPLPTFLQRTPVSLTKKAFHETEGGSCSTPVEGGSFPGRVRPFAFNTMSPLQSKTVALADEMMMSDQQDPAEDTSSIPQDQDETNCLSNVIADAIREGYDLRSEHAGELEIFHFAQVELDSAADTSSVQEKTQSYSNLDAAVQLTEPEKFGFQKYLCPELLTKHPPPASGKDDDPEKLREILDDLLIKLGHDQTCSAEEKILFGPDHKIGKNLVSLRNHSSKYAVFLPEFPLLHVRKHKITILFSAYKDAGLIQLLRYMRDEEEEDWKKLLSAAHIDTATRQIRRLSVAFHIAFLITFFKSLPVGQKTLLQSALESGETSKLSEEWGGMYDRFIEDGCKQNATFCLHVEMMRHLDDVVAVSLAERLGGPSGYNLLLSSLKSSLLFSFLNGAVSYAPYTMQLILEHYRSSPFHQAMKMALYSTPRPGSSVNFSGDTKREMDHLDALKGFRSGSTLSSVSKRMALVDSFQEVHEHYTTGHGLSKDKTDSLGWELSTTDWNHILPTVAVILRRGGISIEPNEVPANVYSRKNASLDPIILDSVSAPVGVYLLQRSACKLGLLGLTINDIPEPESMTGPKHLVKKVASSKTTTIRRTAIKTVTVPFSKSHEERQEDKRQKVISQEVKQIQRKTSRMNMCQALVNADCTKPTIHKSLTMPSALLEYVKWAKKTLGEDDDLESLIILSKSLGLLMPVSARHMAQVATIEFGGIKYKVKASTPSGKAYIESVQNDVLLKFLNYLPSLQSMVVCEEKYDFTPDLLKSATRAQRSHKENTSIAHLKSGEEMLGESTFSKKSIVSTSEGKTIISNYLAENASQLDIHKDIEIIIDSGLKTKGCSCTTSTCASSCLKYAVPINCTFSVEKGLEKIQDVPGVKQRKGEGEMSQIDWLVSSIDNLVPGRSAISIVSSGDIDAVVLHMLAVALKWPRDRQGQFQNPVYVILSKPGDKFDIYCITEILQTLEKATGDSSIGVKIAVGLCIGGNDFLPRYNFYGNHSKVLSLLTKNQHFLENLIKISSEGTITLDRKEYQQFIKQLYIPTQDTSTMSFDEVRKCTIIKNSNMVEKWLPPSTCIQRMADLTSIVIEYMMTAGDHEAVLPDLEKAQCFKVTASGKIFYDFGPDAHEAHIDTWCESLTGTPVKRTTHGTVKRRQKSGMSASRKRLFNK